MQNSKLTLPMLLKIAFVVRSHQMAGKCRSVDSLSRRAFQNPMRFSHLSEFQHFRIAFGMHEQRDLAELWMIHYTTPEFSLIQPKRDLSRIPPLRLQKFRSTCVLPLHLRRKRGINRKLCIYNRLFIASISADLTRRSPADSFLAARCPREEKPVEGETRKEIHCTVSRFQT